MKILPVELWKIPKSGAICNCDSFKYQKLVMNDLLQILPVEKIENERIK